MNRSSLKVTYACRERGILFSMLPQNKNFLFIWIARMVSGLGDWIFLISMPLYIFHITESTLATGSASMVQMIPRLTRIFCPFLISIFIFDNIFLLFIAYETFLHIILS